MTRHNLTGNKRWIVCSTLILFLVTVHQGYSQRTSVTLRHILQPVSFNLALDIQGEKIKQPQLLVLFYSATEYELAWRDGTNVIALITALTDAYTEGLNPQDYHFNLLQSYFRNAKMTEIDSVEFDVLLTDAFLTYSSHILSGKSDPELLYPNKWSVERRRLNLPQVLQNALSDKNIATTLDGLKPQYVGYGQLKEQLKHFRNIQACGWPTIPEGPPLICGDSSERILLVRERLISTGHLHVHAMNGGVVYDSVLEIAVKKFQEEHGLATDGVIGMRTLRSLNVPVDSYIDKLKINLERFRWLPWELGEKYVYVNIPDFRLQVRLGDSIVMSMKAIMGRSERSTPVFSSHIRCLILNPTWTVPPTILKEDVLPAVKKNSHYLKKNNLRLFNKHGEEVDPAELPWSTYTHRNFPYQIRQDPGIYNSLGLIKFQFQNQYQVFLHDTNARYLFSQTNRALSSGCIRIEHPFVLATWLLSETKWTQEKLNKEVSSGKTRTIIFSEQIPIHILYFTAFVEHDDILNFREDIYDLDKAVLLSLAGQ
jgi:L,D-transpeptidase YcbB